MEKEKTSKEEDMTTLLKETSTSIEKCSDEWIRKMAIQRLSRTVAIIWTVLYAFAFPFLCRKVFVSATLFQDPTLTPNSCFILIGMDALCALVIPVSLWLMWQNLKKQNYERMHFFGALPLVVFIIYILLRIEFLDLFLSRTVEGITT